ncbi:ATP phosphoribosyltransferase [Fodinicola acaciae]|uniref:ATP phosphoribosyltransferase n=1 Tax=Fodinicola acaciae TaxID=2681555 RepID=UPI0013D38804|nr:ATP phosphoribosyltransferase [Fodinicola acaciae]
MQPTRTLRIALPNKGSLAEPAATMLREAGYHQRGSQRELAALDAKNHVEFFYLRPRDIATYVGSGEIDLGITGWDLLQDAGVEAETLLKLGFGGSTFRYAARPGAVKELADLNGLRIATSFPGLVAAHLARHGHAATIIRLDGAVESSIRLGVADAIADVVETGSTLRAAGLEIVLDPIMESEAVLVRRPGDRDESVWPAVELLLRRLQGVLVARQYVMLAYDVEEAILDRATALTPGIESPTVSKLRREGWVAVQAMILRSEMHPIMDALYEVGARAILTTDIHACRL